MNRGWRFSYSGAWSAFVGELSYLALDSHYGCVFGCDYSLGLSITIDGRTRVYHDEREITEAGRLGRARLSDHASVMAFVADSSRAQEAVNVLSNEILDRSFAGATAQACLDAFRSTNERLVLVYAHYQFSASYFTDCTAERMRQEIAQRAFDPVEVLGILTATPANEFQSFAETRSWLTILEFAEADGVDGKRTRCELEKHVRRYGFLGLSGASSNQGTDLESYTARLLQTDMAQVRRLRRRIERANHEVSKLEWIAKTTAQRLGLSTELARAGRNLAALSASRLHLREAFQRLYWARQPLMARIREILTPEDESEIPEYLFERLRIQEIEDGLQGLGIPTRAELEERHAYSCMLLDRGLSPTIQHFSGEKARRLGGAQEPEPMPMPILQGLPIFGSGTIYGSAEVVKASMTGAEIDNKCFSDRIVVMHMSRPDIVPLLTDAMALVTEQGGITSHAAVIARELRLPCIVGVADATRILETGDLLRLKLDDGRIEKVVELPRGISSRKAVRMSPIARPTAAPITRAAFASPLIPLESPVAADEKVVGRKAADLHRIRQWTPRGLIIPVETMNCLFMSKSASRYLPSVADFLADPETAELRRALQKQLEAFRSRLVVVRSSHDSEGDEVTSFSGLFESCINVRRDDPHELWTAIFAVAASEQSTGVRRYQDLTGISDLKAGMAVLIQEMIHSTVLGVATTREHRFGKEWLVVEYAADVDDERPVPDFLPTGRVAAERELLRNGNSLSAQLIPASLETYLAPKVIDLLGARLHAIEQILGKGQEIEWCVDSRGELWIFQSRSRSAEIPRDIP